MAFTRECLAHNWSLLIPGKIKRPGFIKQQVKDNVVHTWAIARPCFGWDGNGAPYYLGTPKVNRVLPNYFIKGGNQSLFLSSENKEMDPSDHSTWQRHYIFS